ncbi:MAG: oligosaccharide flippase family protein [Erysipelotrichaceae bacterium]|nr:oligosaccharide flippase family protein [Erysipelotrichaceae bacterium]
MDKKLLKNYIYNILYQMVKIVIPLITLPYTYAHIGAATLGISDFAYNISGWFILFGVLGVNTYGNREIAKVRDNQDELNRTFWEIFWMKMLNMVLAGACYLVYVTFFVSKNQFIYYLTGLSILASATDICWLYYGVEDFKKASIRNIIVKLVGVALILTFVKTPEQLWLYVIFTCGSELLGQLIMFLQLKQYIQPTKISLKDAYKHHFKATFALFVPTIAISVYTMLDQTMIGFLHSELHLNYYKTSMSFIKMFLYFITSIGEVILPRMTNVYYNSESGEDKAKALINTTMKIAMLLALPLCFGMIGVASYLIPWYAASAPELAPLIMLGCPIIIFISMSNVTGIQYLVPTGNYSVYSRSVVIGACINACVNAALIGKFGAYGAIIGSIIAEFMVTLVQYLSVRKSVKINFLDASYFKYLMASVLMCFGVLMIGRFMGASIVTNMVQIIFGVIFYFGFLLISKEELLYTVLDKVVRRNV